MKPSSTSKTQAGSRSLRTGPDHWGLVGGRLRQYALLMRLDKPIGIFLLIWPTLWALWIAAEGWPDPLVLVVFVCGVVLMRSAGCVINDFADRKIDPHVERTRDRPLAAGRVRPFEALQLFVILCLVAFGLVTQLNELTVYLSFGAVAIAIVYPFLKRYTYLPQIALGAGFAWAIPMAFAAQTGEVPRIAWLIFTAAVVWTTAYDTMYAMVDRKDDIRIGVKSTAILFGDLDRLMIAVLQALVLMALVMLGFQLELSLYYFAGLLAAAVLAGYQQYLIREREPRRCFYAFLNNNWFGAVVFIGLVLHYLLGVAPEAAA